MLGIYFETLMGIVINIDPITFLVKVRFFGRL
jgi:hypothetical protein